MSTEWWFDMPSLVSVMSANHAVQKTERSRCHPQVQKVCTRFNSGLNPSASSCASVESNVSPDSNDFVSTTLPSLIEDESASMLTAAKSKLRFPITGPRGAELDVGCT